MAALLLHGAVARLQQHLEHLLLGAQQITFGEESEVVDSLRQRVGLMQHGFPHFLSHVLEALAQFLVANQVFGLCAAQRLGLLCKVGGVVACVEALLACQVGSLNICVKRLAWLRVVVGVNLQMAYGRGDQGNVYIVGKEPQKVAVVLRFLTVEHVLLELLVHLVGAHHLRIILPLVGHFAEVQGEVAHALVDAELRSLR